MHAGADDGYSADSVVIPRGCKQILRYSGGDVKEMQKWKTYVLTSTGAITVNPVATDNPPATSFKSNSQDDVLNAK